MTLIYFASLDKYLSTIDGCYYTDEDLDYFMDLEREWKASQPNYSFYELMDIFPEAIKPARRSLKANIKALKKNICSVNEHKAHYQEAVINKAHFSEQDDLKKESEKYFNETRGKIESKIKTFIFQLSHLDSLEGKTTHKNFNGVDDREIEQARTIPITNFYTGKLQRHGKRAKGKCPFHKEKTASFVIYLDQNSFYCYGACGKGGSVIDYVMEQQKCGFLDAVKFILK